MSQPEPTPTDRHSDSRSTPSPSSELRADAPDERSAAGLGLPEASGELIDGESNGESFKPPSPIDSSLGAHSLGHSPAAESLGPKESHLDPEVVSNTTMVESRPLPKRYQSKTWADVVHQFVWALGLVAMVVVVWRLGPRLIEEYHYSARLGEARAEYQNAMLLLQDEPLANMSNAYKLVAQKVRPSVVSIVTRRPADKTKGQGSGIIISKEGYIVTSAHVVENAREITVRLYNRYPYTGTLVASDSNSDLAIIKIDARDLIPAEWGDSESLEVGSLVWAIGSPYGLDQTVTSGIISGKHRVDQDSNYELLQTDAAVNPGNSGGPLVDANGNVIGINTSIFGESFQGISFAVPSETARFVVDQLLTTGKVQRGYLGVYPMPVRERTAQQNAMNTLNGAFVRNVDRNTPADRSGLRPRDIIIEWDGRPVIVHTMLHRFIERTPPNSQVPIKIIREGKEMVIFATVGDRSEYVPEEF